MSDTDIAVAEEEEQPLSERVAKFGGNPFKFLLYMLRNPDATQAEAMRSIDLKAAPATIFAWRHDIPDFQATLNTIKDSKVALRNEFAIAAIAEAVPDITVSMIERAKGTGRDGQRAGERLLETVGVLSKPGIDISQVDSVDMIAIRLRMKSTKPVPAIEAEFREVPIADDELPPATDHSVTAPSVDDKGHVGAE